jgi:hypothetical protein
LKQRPDSAFGTFKDDFLACTDPDSSAPTARNSSFRHKFLQLITYILNIAPD